MTTSVPDWPASSPGTRRWPEYAQMDLQCHQRNPDRRTSSTTDPQLSSTSRT